ncbi:MULTISPECIES: VOC family protein [Enterobacteriaceae]|uniref:VOC family protein n=1 Tax=Citrobacter bitternis TaxID=1585982 RepID=A0ABW1PTQ0_9ENTR|nr:MULTISPECIES: VOC family protein [Enterobacteriaceae]QOV69176.1 VOC family protein [Citrobacter sp. BDA59-3]
MKIAHVALWTRNLDAQVAFWQEVFGGQSNERYLSKNRPGFASHFISLSEGPTIELMALPELDDAPANPEFVGWAHIAITVGGTHEVDAMAQKAQANGCLLSPARWTGDGFYEAVIADPDGNRIELVAA